MGPNYSISTACATANYAFVAAANHIRKGEADVMLVGGSEAPIIPVGLGGFVACRHDPAACAHVLTTEMALLAILSCFKPASSSGMCSSPQGLCMFTAASQCSMQGERAGRGNNCSGGAGRCRRGRRSR